MTDRFPIRNLDTGEVYSHDTFDGFAPSSSSPSAPASSLASEADTNAFRKLFAAFGKDERLHYALKCRLWESLAAFHSRKTKKRHQGTMFISSDHLSFAEENAQRKPVKIGIPLSEVVSLSPEDFDLSEGILVSTRRDTKFYFEQFSSRSEAFESLQYIWKRVSSPVSSAPVASVFDPLGGISASSAPPHPSSPSPFSSKSFSPLQHKQLEQRSSPRRPQPVPSHAPPPPPPQSSASSSAFSLSSPSLEEAPTHSFPKKDRRIPATESRQKAVFARPSKALSTSRAPQSTSTGKMTTSNSTDFMVLHPSDDWFMTLTKIYYQLGKVGSIVLPARVDSSSTVAASTSGADRPL